MICKVNVTNKWCRFFGVILFIFSHGFGNNLATQSLNFIKLCCQMIIFVVSEKWSQFELVRNIQ